MSFSLVATDISYAYGPTEVLVGVSLVVSPSTRLGVVAPNGTGKSTLLRILAHEVEPDRGTVVLSPPSTSIGYIAQERDVHPGELVENALARRTGVAAASAALDVATAQLVEGTAGADDSYADALERWLALGGADLAHRAENVFGAMGIEQPASLLRARTDELSGGQMARVALASIVLARYDVVLLDEPTNDLDFAGLDALERFVIDHPGGVVIVSHDRAFLERTITSVLEIDEHSHTATLFNGGWTAFLDERETNRSHAQRAYVEFRERRQNLVDRAQRQREWAVTGIKRAAKQPNDHDKAQRDFRANRTEKLASKVRISERQIERLGVVEHPWEPWQLNLSIAKTTRSGDVVAKLSGAFLERGGFHLGPIDLEIGYGERIALVGPNGSGKSTLVDAIVGRLPLAAGSLTLGRSVVIGELDQQRAVLDPTATVLRAFGDALADDRPIAEIRSLLAKFGVGAEHVNRLVTTLSPGERTRTALALFMARGVNFLVLDEPTNHLDLPAIEQLEMALEEWDATLLLVTHDRRLLESVEFDTTIDLTTIRRAMAP